MDVNSPYQRDSAREELLLKLLRDGRMREINARRSIYGADTEVIMRRGMDIGRKFFCYTSLDRGMLQAKFLIEKEEERGRAFVNGAVIVADQMQGSKGRFDRLWFAPAGGLWVTLVLVPNFLPDRQQFYSLISGIACCECARHFGVRASIKWVNDVHQGGRKIAGVLIEKYTSKVLHEDYLLIGMGINVNNEDFPGELGRTAISLKQISGREIPLDNFLSELLTRFSWYVGLHLHFESRWMEGIYDKEKPSNPLIEKWKSYSDSLGRRVLYGFNVYTEPLFEAVAMDIDESGAILLYREDDDVIVKESSGELIYL